MAVPNDTRRFAYPEDSSSMNVQWPALREHTKTHSARSNDCEWLYQFVSSDAISGGKISPRYLIRVYYKETKSASTTITKNFGTESYALSDLKRCLSSKHVRAVALCHRDSSQVDPEILDLLWGKFNLEVSFLRQHFDYKGFRNETGCPEVILNRLKEESKMKEDVWTFGGRWNPIRLPSETRASILRLSIDSECLSVCCKDGITIALVRSKAVYQEPLGPWNQRELDRHLSSCTIDLFAATTDTWFVTYELPSDSTEFSSSIVHFYARLLVLRCYEDYCLRHDTEPIHLHESDRVSTKDHPHIIAIHNRRLELIKFRQNLFGYLGPLAPEHESSGSSNDYYARQLYSLLTDVEMLSSLYDNTMRIYDWHIHEVDSDYTAELASNQLEEAKESKATAISLGKLSNLAFLYLPVNFVCAMLGMNLSIFGQGRVPVWVFLVLLVLFSLLNYLPIFIPTINEQRRRAYRVACHLTWRSVPAGFWFLAFFWTHNYRQNFEVMNSGLTQVFLGYTGAKTKGWKNGRPDGLFAKASWGSEAFWKEKVKQIFSSVKELDPNDQNTQFTV